LAQRAEEIVEIIVRKASRQETEQYKTKAQETPNAARMSAHQHARFGSIVSSHFPCSAVYASCHFNDR
jgi:hypothetical protein